MKHEKGRAQAAAEDYQMHAEDTAGGKETNGAEESSATGSAVRRIAKRLLGPPDFVIGSHERPYLLRWWLIPRNRFFNVYLHKILRDDDDRALHDHPWTNISVILSGGYLEWRSHAWDKHTDVVWRGRGSIVFRRATDAHRLSLGHEGKPCWSLFITGRRVREWGFHCPKGWRVWHEFVDAKDSGKVGRGCGE